MNLRYRVVLIVGTCLLAINCHAQHFSFKQSINKADSTGFYKLILSPELLAKSKSSLADLRIYDEQGKETAYTIEEAATIHTTKLDSLEIISKLIATDKKMHVVLRNINGAVSDFLFQVQNTDAFRTVNISGSNDQKQWFIIKENIALQKSGDNNASGSYTVNFNVNPVSYNYFDISFNDRDLLPANILSVASIKSQQLSSPSPYDTIHTTSIIRKDSLKHSYLTVNWPEPYPFTHIQLVTTGTKYFRREGYIQYQSGQLPFVITSENDAWIDIENNNKLIEIVLLNADNQPLKITAIRGLIRKQYLYAWLEKDKIYSLYIGDSNLLQPNYDLAYFKDRIKQNTPVRSLGAINSIERKTTEGIKSPKSNTWIWWALGLVILLLLLLTYRLMGDMDKKQRS